MKKLVLIALLLCGGCGPRSEEEFREYREAQRLHIESKCREAIIHRRQCLVCGLGNDFAITCEPKAVEP